MRVSRSLVGVDRQGSVAVFRTNSIDIRVLFLTSDIVRVRAGFDGEFREASYSLVTTAWEDEFDEVMAGERTRIEPATFELIEDHDKVVLQGERLRVEADREPFVLRVVDEDGEVLHCDTPDLAYREDANKRRLHTSQIFEDDRFYGFGEKAGEINKFGHLLTMNPQDSMGYDPIKTDSLYKHIPFYIKLGSRSRRAVGYFYHGSYTCDFDMGKSKSNYWQRSSTYRTDGGDIDLFIIAGPKIRDIIGRFTYLTGRSALLPKQALGYLGSSMYYPELDENCDDAIVEFVDTTKRKGFPADGFQLSSGFNQQETSEGLKRCVLTWNDRRFPDPEDFFARMAERGIIVSPNVKPGFLLVHPDMDEFVDEQIFVREAESDDPAPARWWGGPGHLVDFTDPHARDVWKQKLTEQILDRGTLSVWNDNCEYDSIVDLDSRVHAEGIGGTIAEYKPVMSNLMCKLTIDAIEEKDPEIRPFVVCRSGHTGIQRYAQTWAGDNRTSWDSLKYNIATILGMGLSGVANHGCDIGGFAGPAPEGELLVRWVQNGIFQPRFSVHSASDDNTVTEPWMYSDLADTIRDAMKLRYRMFPYLYSLMVRAHETGLPIVETLASAFQNDPGVDNEGVDFMFGDSLLIANVVEKGQTVRPVRFPAGADFADFGSRAVYEGGTDIEVPVELSTIPMFLRSGGIVPMADHDLLSFGQDDVTGWHILCFPREDGQFTIVEDDGVTRGYERGEVRTSTITMTAGDWVVLDVAVEGDYPTAVERVQYDLVAPEKAPFWVKLDDAELHHFQDREAFDKATSGWYYSQTKKSVQVKFPNPAGSYRVTVSFDKFDLVGM